MRVIGGRLSGRRFGTPGGRGTRPTADRVREGLASALDARGAFLRARVLDLFAGTGALSFEALSRGASHALMVDYGREALQRMIQSAKELGLESRVETARMNLLSDPADAVRKLPMTEPGFDLVFVDAPYDDVESVPPLLEALLAAGRLTPGAWVAVEHPASHAWRWPKGLAPEADYRYGQTRVSLGVCTAEKGQE